MTHTLSVPEAPPYFFTSQHTIRTKHAQKLAPSTRSSKHHRLKTTNQNKQNPQQAVLVHQLSRGATQNPFRKNRGRAVLSAFHPTKPFFFVATQNHVRVYNLAKQALAKKLLGGGGCVTCLAVHPGGDHLLVGSDDRRLAWCVGFVCVVCVVAGGGQGCSLCVCVVEDVHARNTLT
jgi:WD40 repeat protein